MSDERNLNTFLGGWVEQALDLHAAGERVVYSLSTMPGPDGTPIVGVVVWMSSPVLGEALPGVLTIGNPLALTAEIVAEAVRQVLEKVRKARTAALAPSNGHGSVPPGSEQSLLVPGR